MKATYYRPVHKAESFNCPLCGVFAAQEWNNLFHYRSGYELSVPFEVTFCAHCRQYSLWYKEELILPCETPVEEAHQDLPENCLEDYNEARAICSKSPRAAAALLRLCIQNLMLHLGETGKNVNQDIGELVKKGLPTVIQQALDVCRVVGNNAVHPGEIDVKDSPDLAYKLFQLINIIVEDRITRPREIDQLYQSLPEGAREAIEKRDIKK